MFHENGTRGRRDWSRGILKHGTSIVCWCGGPYRDVGSKNRKNGGGKRRLEGGAVDRRGPKARAAPDAMEKMVDGNMPAESVEDRVGLEVT